MSSFTSQPQSTATPGSITASGSISSLFSGGFTLNTGPLHGYIHVYTSSSTTVSGPSPFVGESVNVSGTGSLSTSITATSVSQVGSGVTAPATSSSPIPNPKLVATSGNVVAVSSGRFEINQGAPHGYIWVYNSSGMTVTGGTVAVGSYVQVAGSGSPSTSITATIVSVWSSAPPSTTLTGTVVAGTAYGFTMSVDASHPNVPVVLTMGTVIAGSLLAPGATASVTGPGNAANAITAVQVVVSTPTPTGSVPTPTPGPIAQTHLVTADYLGAPDGNGWVTPAQAGPYVSWAQSYVSNANALHAAGIKVQMYANPNRSQTNDPMHTSDLSTYAKSCTGIQVTDLYKSITQYVMDPNSSTMQALFHNTMVKQIGTNHVDALFVDDSGPLSEFPTTYLPTLPCNYSDQGWINGEIALDNNAPVPVIFNGLNVLNGHNPSMSIGMLAGSNTFGGNYEHCYSDSANPKSNGWLWQATENTELQVLAQNKTFECESLNTASAASSYDMRTYALASFLLTYDPQNAILWEMFGTSSGLHVLPEAGLVPLNPVVAAPADISGLVQTGGAYGREYKQCYLAGNFVGPCAVVVNPNANAPATFPFPQYQHTLVMNGSDALDGGSVATNGPPPPTSIPALGSAIVFP